MGRHLPGLEAILSSKARTTLGFLFLDDVDSLSIVAGLPATGKQENDKKRKGGQTPGDPGGGYRGSRSVGDGPGGMKLKKRTGHQR
jgi:hypothetical protein